LHAFAVKENVPYISLFPKLNPAHKETPIHWPYDAHWNPHGHAIVADVLYTELQMLVPQLQKKAQ
jgi:hypothetical protein